MFDKANSSSCGRSTFNSILSVGRLSGIKKAMFYLKKGCPQSIRCGNTVWYVVV